MHACFIFPSLQREISMLKSKNMGGVFPPNFTFWLTFFYPGIKNFPGCSSACKVLYTVLTVFSECYMRRKFTVGK